LAKGEKMSNSDTLRTMFGLVCAGDVDGFGEYLADDFVEHEVAPGMEPTKTGTKQLFAMLIAAYPDLRFDTEDVIESGEKVVARSRITGTNKGDFMGAPASGKNIDIQAIDIVRFGDDGLVHEHWGVMDIMSMMQQIGAIPQGPPPA
jgi:steroid delta-isomerase-like uncharacterized protein